MSLSAKDEAALERVAEATAAELRDAAARMPSYQRSALQWLKRELDLLARAPTDSPGGETGQAPEPGRQSALGQAALERSRLSRQIADSGACTADKAFMQQTLAHLWVRVVEACPCSHSTR